MVDRHLIALGRAVRELREEQGLSHAALAARMAWDVTTIVSVERGERDPGFDELLRLADALGVAVSGLVARAESHYRDGS